MAYCWITFKFDDISGRDSRPVDSLSEGAQSWLRSWILHQKAPHGTEMEVRRAQDPAEAEEATPHKPWLGFDLDRRRKRNQRQRKEPQLRSAVSDGHRRRCRRTDTGRRYEKTHHPSQERSIPELWPARSETNHHLTPVTCRRRGT